MAREFDMASTVSGIESLDELEAFVAGLNARGALDAAAQSMTAHRKIELQRRPTR
jgi:hypothetical protein